MKIGETDMRRISECQFTMDELETLNGLTFEERIEGYKPTAITKTRIICERP